MDIIRKYFPDLTPEQIEQFSQLLPLYNSWNSRINVISRKDMDNFYINHVLHSLAIAKVISFAPGSRIMDVGTGGGFPGIPLAIMFPQCSFHLVDSIEKKIRVVTEVAEELKLENVFPQRERAEYVEGPFDFIVSRAVTALPVFMPWVKNKISSEQKNELANGVLYLKGGDFADDLKGIKHQYTLYPISGFFSEEFFETKKVVHLYRRKIEDGRSKI